MIGDDGIVTIAATLEAVIPPAGYQNVGSIRYIRAEDVSEDRHSFFQSLFIWLIFNALWFPIRQSYHQNIGSRECILHVLMTMQHIRTSKLE